MTDYWTKKDTSRPEDEWQLPLDHPDNPDNPDSQGNKLKAATQALSDRLAQEKHSLGNETSSWSSRTRAIWKGLDLC